MTTIELLKLASQAAVNAGLEIMKVYASEIVVENKADNSPLTLADQAAHHKIKEFLNASGIPLLSEEGKEYDFEERKKWNTLWIVDPLDGTKEFIKRNGEFTVNIALIQNNYPVLGVIYVPVTEQLYFGSAEHGAFLIKGISSSDLLNKIESNTYLDHAISLPDVENKSSVFRLVASRSHMSPETENFIREQEQKHGKVELVSMGSSLKICLVAEGKAEMYPRFAPTMEWDTAAGQAIAEAAGKNFIDYQTGVRMKYNRENLRNNWFLVS